MVGETSPIDDGAYVMAIVETFAAVQVAVTLLSLSEAVAYADGDGPLSLVLVAPSAYDSFETKALGPRLERASRVPLCPKHSDFADTDAPVSVCSPCFELLPGEPGQEATLLLAGDELSGVELSLAAASSGPFIDRLVKCTLLPSGTRMDEVRLD